MTRARRAVSLRGVQARPEGNGPAVLDLSGSPAFCYSPGMARTRHISNIGLNARQQSTRSARFKLSIKRAERRDREEKEAQAWAEERRRQPLVITAQEETAQIVTWAQDSLRVPTTGQPWRVADGVAAWLHQALDRTESGLLCEDSDVQRDTLCGLLLYFLVGPRVAPGWRAIVASPTPLSTSILREELAASAEAAELLQPDGPLQVSVNPYPGQATGKAGAGVRFQALNNEHTGHAVGADLVLVVDLDPDNATHRHAYNRLTTATATSSQAHIWRISLASQPRMEWTS